LPWFSVTTTVRASNGTGNGTDKFCRLSCLASWNVRVANATSAPREITRQGVLGVQSRAGTAPNEIFEIDCDASATAN